MTKKEIRALLDEIVGDIDAICGKLLKLDDEAEKDDDLFDATFDAGRCLRDAIEKLDTY